jgi:acyl-CoA thioester hydrolase
MLSAELKQWVRWADADAAGRIYFPRIFDYFCEAEGEILRKAGHAFGVGGTELEFPRVHVQCQFKKILRLGVSFTMRASVKKLGRTSIHYDFLVSDQFGEIAAYGTVVVALIRHGKRVEIPPALRAALSAE